MYSNYNVWVEGNFPLVSYKMDNVLMLEFRGLLQYKTANVFMALKQVVYQCKTP